MDENEEDPGWGPALMILPLLLIAAVWGFTSATGDEAPPPQQVGIAEHEAWGACKDAVTAMLNNPGSADFAVLSSADGIAQPGGGYDFAGALSAENEFGVEQDLAFTCEVDKDGKAVADVNRAG